MKIDLIHGECLEIMSFLPDASIDMLITSPPYNCGKVYGEFADNRTWEDYWEHTSKWLIEARRVLKNGSRLAVVLPWWMGKKPRRDVPYEFKRIAIAAGFLFLDKIIWIKGNEDNVHTSGGFGGGGCGWGTYMSPSGPSIRCASEPILIFSVGSRGRGIISGEGRGACVRGDMNKDEWMEWTLDTWFVRGKSDKEHPATFPIDIPTRLIKLYTYPHEVVLDSFMGSGTTGIACQNSDRNFIGIEQDEKYFKIAQRRMAMGDCLAECK